MDFREACDKFGGEYQETHTESRCTVQTHMGSVTVTIDRQRLAKIDAHTKIASFSVDFGLRGEPVKDIFYSAGFLTIRSTKGNTCALNRHGKVIYGTCLLDGKIVSFYVDP